MRKAIRAADSAGVFGAIFAALCCAGLPLILAVLSAIGLSSIRRDSILIPLMGISLAVALWGFLSGRRLHHAEGPVILASAGSAALVAGVVYLHGPSAKGAIGGGAIALVAATVWNIRLRRACTTMRPRKLAG